MHNSGAGDKLASGQLKAQFSTSAGLSNFANDLIFIPDKVEVKYGLTAKQVEEYQSQRLSGKKLPDLPTKEMVEEEAEDKADAMRLGYTVSDKRMPIAATVEPAPLKFPAKEYAPFKPVLEYGPRYGGVERRQFAEQENRICYARPMASARKCGYSSRYW
jgi:hypothetical protein